MSSADLRAALATAIDAARAAYDAADEEMALGDCDSFPELEGCPMCDLGSSLQAAQIELEDWPADV